MNTCPNCGYRHADTYAPELSELVLPMKRAEVLLRLQQANGAIVTADQLIEAVWDAEDEPETARNLVHGHIHKLNLEIAPMGWMIKSMRNQGYRLMRIDA